MTGPQKPKLCPGCGVNEAWKMRAKTVLEELRGVEKMLGMAQPLNRKSNEADIKAVAVARDRVLTVIAGLRGLCWSCRTREQIAVDQHLEAKRKAEL